MSPRVLVATAVSLALFLLAPGCGEDDGDGGFKPGGSFREATSPENLIYDIAFCFNKMDYDRFVPLIHDDFTCVFSDDDVGGYPEVIPRGGVWGRVELLTAVQKMFDPSYVPCEPSLKIEDLQMELELSGAAVPTNVQMAPAGTVEGFVTLDLRINTVGGTTYLVDSRPDFFFAPDSTQTTVIWQLWRVVDAPFEEPTSAAHGQATPADHRGSSASRETQPHVAEPDCNGATSETPSWGGILGYFSRGCDKTTAVGPCVAPGQ